MTDYTEGSGRQYHTNLKEGDVGRYVLLPGDPKRCEKIAAFFDNPKLIADSREYVTYAKCGVDTFIRVGTCGGIREDILGGDIVIASGAVRMEGTSREFAPIEYPAVANFDVTTALINASKALQLKYHVGVVQCKDSFFGQHEPEIMPVSYELENKWEAYKRMGCLASEMESAALFIAGDFLRARVGSCFLTVANQERAKKGLENKQVHDTTLAIKVGIEAIKELIKLDKM